MTLSALYDDDEFNDELVRLSHKNLLEPDDYRQEVFLYLLESPEQSPWLVAKRVAMRMRRKQQRDSAVSLDQMGDIADETDQPSVLWEDRHLVGK